MNTRRKFLISAPLGLLGAAAAARADQLASEAPPPGAPPAFNTAAPVGPEVSSITFAEAEKLVQVTLAPAEHEMAAQSWRTSMAGLVERRTGPRALRLGHNVAPALQWNPTMGNTMVGPSRDRFIRSAPYPVPLPERDEDIAFAPVTQLSRWIEAKWLTSDRLTRIYLDRIERFDPKLRAVITVTREHALRQAAQADREIGGGQYRGPLHGIPYGVKDLLDTAGIATTYGAEPFKDRVPARDSVVVERLSAAGAVLIAKLSLGALAFSIGSETGGSIVSPSMRCGATGLRPTYGRVARTGAMTLCWSLDKLGPMTRSVEDAMLVLKAISVSDPGDVASVVSRLDFDANAPVKGLRVGYVADWMNEPPATDVDRAALENMAAGGMTLRQVALPDWPYGCLDLTLFAEAAASFEELVLSRGVDQLRMQVPDAWPNIFRQARFLSAVDLVQAARLRRMVAQEMARVFSEVDLMIVPSLRDDMLSISNQTGHPSLTLRTGTVEVSEARSDWAPDPANPLPRFSPPRRVPHGVTLIGRLFDEGTIARAGLALERAAGLVADRPPGF